MIKNDVVFFYIFYFLYICNTCRYYCMANDKRKITQKIKHSKLNK